MSLSPVTAAPSVRVVSRCVLLLSLLLAAAAGCSREPAARRYQLTGHVLALKPDGSEITIRHDEIKGFMPAMTMPFTLKDRKLARGLLPGDLVKATLMVTDEEAWLADLEKTGWAPFPDAAATTTPSVEVLRPGEEVPDVTLVDQDGAAFRLSSLRGRALLVTFVYTRCPLPDFCPRMNRNFQAIQALLEARHAPVPIHLVSISFDPDYDTPAVLEAHAMAMKADRRLWTWATGPSAAVDAFGARFGLSVLRTPADRNSITHNLRTAVIDARGRLVRVLDGNGWTPDEAMAALASTPAS